MINEKRDRNIEAAVCYIPILAIIITVVVLVVEQEDKFVRFHAMQGLITVLIYFVSIFILGSLPFVGIFISVGIFLFFLIFWIYGIVNSYKGHFFKFPIIGKFAEKKVR